LGFLLVSSAMELGSRVDLDFLVSLDDIDLPDTETDEDDGGGALSEAGLDWTASPWSGDESRVLDDVREAELDVTLLSDARFVARGSGDDSPFDGFFGGDAMFWRLRLRSARVAVFGIGLRYAPQMDLWVLALYRGFRIRVTATKRDTGSREKHVGHGRVPFKEGGVPKSRWAIAST
jgi:hypothetical protein